MGVVWLSVFCVSRVNAGPGVQTYPRISCIPSSYTSVFCVELLDRRGASVFFSFGDIICVKSQEPAHRKYRPDSVFSTVFKASVTNRVSIIGLRKHCRIPLSPQC